MGTIHQLRPPKKPENWRYAFSVGFSIQAKHTCDTVTEEELLQGMEKRIKYLRANPGEIFAACGFPESPEESVE